MIGLNHKFLFVHIPKTAGNAIQNILLKYSEDQLVVSKLKHDGVERFGVESTYGTSKHTKLLEYKKVLPPEIYDSLFKFTIVRNPWDRVVSRYFFKKMKREFEKGLTVNEIQEKPFDRKEFIRVINTTPTLESFLLENPGNGKIDFLKDTDIDFFIRFERLQEDFDEVCTRLGIEKEALPVRNQSKHKDFRTYYDQETKALVYMRHKNEIDYFQYTC